MEPPVSAVRWNADYRDFYERLRDRGTLPKAALRELLALLRADRLRH